MSTQNRFLTRSLAYLLAGVAGFVVVLATLPTPDITDAPTAGVHEENFAIVNVTLFDGESFRRDQDLWIESGSVKYFGRKLKLPDELPRLDGRGLTLVPGLIDGHVHTFGETLSDALRFGVTTVMDQATHIALAQSKRPIRKTLAPSTEADLFSAGMPATAPNGHGTQFGFPVEPVTTPTEAAEWVRARISEGSDWIKIVYEDGSAYGVDIPSLSGEIVAALVRDAHNEGLLAVVHVSTLERALEATSFGADGLLHVWDDAIISEEDARYMADAGIFVVPTLSVVISDPDSVISDLVENTSDVGISPMQRATLANPTLVHTRDGTDIALENVRRLHAAGVRLVAGTDAPNPGTASGLSMHGELRFLRHAGLESAEVLASATSIAAEAFGVSERGRLAEGYRGDLLLVRGDLEENLSHSNKIAAVWKNGYLVDLLTTASTAQDVIVPAHEGGLIADFEHGTQVKYGTGWAVTTDAMQGGSSNASYTVQNGVMVVNGEITQGFPFPWAGVMWIAGEQSMGSVDFPDREVIRFRTRGDGRQYSVMLFGTTNSVNAPPPSVKFAAEREWKEIEIALADFPTAEPHIIAALAFVAEGPPGEFEFELDELGIW